MIDFDDVKFCRVNKTLDKSRNISSEHPKFLDLFKNPNKSLKFEILCIKLYNLSGKVWEGFIWQGV